MLADSAAASDDDSRAAAFHANLDGASPAARERILAELEALEGPSRHELEAAAEQLDAVASSIDGMRHSSFKSPLRSFDALNKHMADVPTLTAERAIGTQANGFKFGLKIVDAHACHDATRASSLTWAMSWPVAK